MSAKRQRTNEDISGSSGGGEDGKRQGLLSVNDLTYVLEPDLSVAVNKTHKVHYFQNNEYKQGQRSICILNSGADYIDTRRSFLTFDLFIPEQLPKSYVNGDPLAVVFGNHGSACNLIDNITITTRSGDELCRIKDFNMLQNILIPIQKSADWKRTQGGPLHINGAYHYNESDPISTYLDAHTNNGLRCCIPMYLLSPIFSYGRLMPNILMSGLRIEIQWSTTKDALQSVGLKDQDVLGNTVSNVPCLARVAANDFSIKNPQFHLSSVQLSDSIERALNDIAGTNGLEIIYCDYEKTEAQQSAGEENVHVEVRKSASRALKAYARVSTRDLKGKKNGEDRIQDLHQKDLFRGEKHFPWTSYQWQLGSLYFPQQKVAGDPHEVAIEAFQHLLDTEDAVDSNSGRLLQFYGELTSGGEWYHISKFGSEPGANFYNDWQLNEDQVLANAAKENPKLAGLPGSYYNDQHTIAVNLERSSMFNLAGVPVNNSRVLALHGTLAKGSREYVGLGSQANLQYQFERVIHVYLKYVKLARCFLNNVEVEQ